MQIYFFAFHSNDESSALIIKEALRLHPAVALSLERIVPEGGLTAHGYTLPAGTIVGINGWVLHYDEDVFGPDAHVFRPERWEESSDPVDIQRLKIMERSFFAVCYICLSMNYPIIRLFLLIID
jgi:cytochrome P450